MGLRCFVAIKLDHGVMERVAALLRELKKTQADFKWVEPHNLHFTLRFLGTVEEAALVSLRTGLRSAVQGTPQFNVEIAGIGGFPSRNNPRVLWAGVSVGADSMKRLAEAVENEVVRLGFKPEDKGFSPHLTLGRIRSRFGLERVLRLVDGLVSWRGGSMTVRSVWLMRSTLTPAGPIYDAIDEYPLEASP